MKRLLMTLAAVVLVASACSGNAPTQNPEDRIATGVAGTMAAYPTPTSPPTDTPPPTETPLPIPTSRPTSANRSTHIPHATVDVIDGDTVEVADTTYRLIGIDSPEVDECGGDVAAAMAGVFFDQHQSFNFDVWGKDKYDRTLAFITSGDEDFGLWMIEGGFALARYDGLDGYDRHERQDEYRSASSSAQAGNVGLWATCGGFDTPLATSQPTIKPVPTATYKPAATQGPGNCSPAYPTVCIPPPPPDLDCGDISYRRFTVLPPDPHNFDGDHDGVGCES